MTLPFPGTMQERIERDCIPEPNSGCWLWLGYINTDGYGRLRWRVALHSAHRFSWIAHYGLIPNNMEVLHRCDNPPCVNPEHLLLGTHHENINDMMKKGRQQRGEKSGRAKLTEEQVLTIRQSKQTGVALAQKYGVDARTISEIRTRRNWKHI